MEHEETLELGKIPTEIPIAYRAVKELQVTDCANDHGTLTLTLVLEDTVKDSEVERLKQSVHVMIQEGEYIFIEFCYGATYILRIEV